MASRIWRRDWRVLRRNSKRYLFRLGNQQGRYRLSAQVGRSQQQALKTLPAIRRLPISQSEMETLPFVPLNTACNDLRPPIASARCLLMRTSVSAAARFIQGRRIMEMLRDLRVQSSDQPRHSWRRVCHPPAHDDTTIDGRPLPPQASPVCRALRWRSVCQCGGDTLLI